MRAAWGKGERMPSITGMMDLIAKLESPYITVHQDRCVLVRNCNASCLRCAEVCTSGCISFDGEELTVSPSKCIGCGTCATVCPTCCLEAHHPNDAEFMTNCRSAAELSQGTVVIACGELLDKAKGRFDSHKVVRVECLGRVEETALTQLVAEGAAEVVLAHGSCSGCPHATGRAMVERVLACEKTLLDAWNRPMPIRLAGRLPGFTRAADEGYDVDRRAAFRQSGQEAARVGAVLTEFAISDALTGDDDDAEAAPAPRYAKVMADGTLPHFLPDRRERLLDALSQMGEPQDVMMETRLWGHVIIDVDVCNSCRMCAVFCPTGALRKFDAADGSFGVEHYPGDCVKCRCCENICPTGALSISDEVFAVDMLRGMTDAYAMKRPAVQKGTAHGIWHTAELFTNIKEVYER